MSENNAINKLLAFDRDDIVRKKDIHKMALSKLGGTMFEFEIQALNAEALCHIQDTATKFAKQGAEININTYEPMVFSIIQGCPTIFHNNEVRKHYDCPSFEHLVDLLLTKNEMDELSDAIIALGDIEPNDLDISDAELKN